MFGTHYKLERKSVGLALAIMLVASIGGLIEIAPLFTIDETVENDPAMRLYTPLELAGRNIYLREGCYGCHSQMIRTLKDEVDRYGPYSLAVESQYDHPMLWGSKRTGPDLLRVGGKYTDAWHRLHMTDPRAVVPASIMPAYPWLADRPADDGTVVARLKALRTLGHPYSDEDVEGAPAALAGKTELDGVVAYLQSLGKFAPPEPAADAHGGH